MTTIISAPYGSDPVWIARIYATTGGQDYLGLRAVQASMTNYLLPGIITTTLRARYYAFYSWLLSEYGRAHPQGWPLSRFIHRREQVFALANIACADQVDTNAGVAGLTGQDKLIQHWQTHGNDTLIPLTLDDYVRATNGGFDVYSGVFQTLGLIRYEDGNRIGLLPRAQRLAESFAQAISDTAYYRQREEYDTAESISQTVLLEYGGKCHLSYLACSADCSPTLETLYAFDAEDVLPDRISAPTSLGNMRGTLGMIMDMAAQTTQPLSDDRFRRNVAYGLCYDYDDYRPSVALRPFVAHWQVFQLREYYVYALYALWCYFLYWLRHRGPATLIDFGQHLSGTLDLTGLLAEMEADVNVAPPDRCHLGPWFDVFLDACAIPRGDRDSRCVSFANLAQMCLNEHKLYLYLEALNPEDPRYAGVAWRLLSAVWLRLRGIEPQDEHNAWQWAWEGESRRRSLGLYVRDIERRIESGLSVLETMNWLFRDYVVAQHTISSLEKWRQRRANTFLFNYDGAAFEWVANDQTGFSASRFRQAFDMLIDLGLCRTDSDGHPSLLTDKGQSTLKRVLESLDGRA